MNLHEYQAKQILQKYGVPIPDFFVISSIEELENCLKSHPLTAAVLKIQIHAGGRGKAGGVQFAHHLAEIIPKAKALLGKTFVTPQTGPEGLIAEKILITSPVKITKEFYLGLTINRDKGTVLLLASPVGGVEIEQVAIEQPEQLLALELPSEGSFRSYQFKRLTQFMGWAGEQAKEGIEIVKKLTRAFHELDAVLLEINPLIETEEHHLLALDVKLAIDENALFRHPHLKSLQDPSQMNSYEARAQAYDLAYVALKGEIGCMVNGAGLAMATMDLIHHCGGHPANFLDVGGGASKEKISEGFKIILSDPHVKAIFVNIFGGIMDCETLAAGIIDAAKEQSIQVPLVVRLEGTHVEEGKALLKKSNLNLINVNDLMEGAEQAVKLSKRD